MVERERRLAGKVSLVPNGIFAPKPATLVPPHEVRLQLGVPPDALLIVCVARLAKEKDISVLVAAMETVAAQFPDVRCVIAGDGPERDAVERQVREGKCGGQIVLAGFCKDALSIINAADVFVLPSRAEPFGLVLLEAMALAKPVVSTAAGGPLEIVKDGETGLLVPPGDPAAIADAIIQFLRDPDFRRTAGGNGLSRFQRQFTAGTMAAATLRVYEQALGARGVIMPIMEEGKCESC
jgi:glycosyltransferase involved in cell wall biosynthesis